MKIITINKQTSTPEENLEKLERLIKEADTIRPYKKKKGLVFKFKSYEELEKFNRTRAAQKL